MTVSASSFLCVPYFLHYVMLLDTQNNIKIRKKLAINAGN